MDEMTKEEFENMKQDAERRLLEMSRPDMPPFPSFVRIPESNEAVEIPSMSEETPILADKIPSGGRIGGLLRYLNIPEMLKSSDSLLLLSLILLLSSEKADETLILALAYILL